MFLLNYSFLRIKGLFLLLYYLSNDIDVRKNFNTFEGFYQKENSKINNIDQINKYYKNIKNNKDDINKKFHQNKIVN